MPSPADLNAQGDALVTLLDGVHPDVTVVTRGVADCLPAILVRPTTGEAEAPSAGGCVCQTRWGLYILVDASACLEDAQELVNALASSCGDYSIKARLKPSRKTPTKLDGIAAAVHAVEPASSFGLTQYNTDGPANAYGAVIPVVIRYDCC